MFGVDSIRIEAIEPKQGVTYKTKRNREDVGVKKRVDYKILVNPLFTSFLLHSVEK